MSSNYGTHASKKVDKYYWQLVCVLQLLCWWLSTHTHTHTNTQTLPVVIIIPRCDKIPRASLMSTHPNGIKISQAALMRAHPNWAKHIPDTVNADTPKCDKVYGAALLRTFINVIKKSVRRYCCGVRAHSQASVRYNYICEWVCISRYLSHEWHGRCSFRWSLSP